MAKNKHAVALGKKTSPAKRSASAQNGRKLKERCALTEKLLHNLTALPDDFVDDESRDCHHNGPTWVCNRPRGHVGPHIAWVSNDWDKQDPRIVGVWFDGPAAGGGAR